MLKPNTAVIMLRVAITHPPTGATPSEQGRQRNSQYPTNRVAGLHYAPKLNTEDVHAIRRSYRYQSRDANMSVLAERYGVSVATIYKIIRNKTWRFTATANAPCSDQPSNTSLSRFFKLTRSAKANFARLVALAPDDPEIQAMQRRYAPLIDAPAVGERAAPFQKSRGKAT